MSKTFVISDTHFFDSEILDQGKARHGIFLDLDDMHETIIRNWNSVVSSTDIVYHLGDVSKLYNEETSKILKRLNGKIHLVLGNHDNLSFSVSNSFFRSISAWVKLEEYEVILSHFPLDKMSYASYGENWGNVHGHMHVMGSPEGKYWNVCVEMIDYTPVELCKLISK